MNLLLHFYLFWLRNINCEYSLEPPSGSNGSNLYPQPKFWTKPYKICIFFKLSISVLLHGLIFVLYLDHSDNVYFHYCTESKPKSDQCNLLVKFMATLSFLINEICYRHLHF